MGRECKVLIVDDEFITRQGISHMIMWEQEGFQLVGEASNGQEGIEMIEKYQPDIVLADIVMPVLNGIEFSMILQEKYPNIKLIILSSYDNFEYVFFRRKSILCTVEMFPSTVSCFCQNN